MKAFKLMILVMLLSGCTSDGGTSGDPAPNRDFRADMRVFVQTISANARTTDPGFIIIPQNGGELLADEAMNPASDYISAIDGVGREDLYYGYYDDNSATPDEDCNYMLSYMDLAAAQGLAVLVTDYCSTHSFMDDSYTRSKSRGYLSFQAERRELDSVPVYPASPRDANSDNCGSLTEAKNFLYLINPVFDSKESFLKAVEETDHDLVIIDLFYNETPLSSEDVSRLRTKKNGGNRLVICYMSIGETENYRYYWQPSWSNDPPSWLAEANPDWEGNFKVRYWDPDWQAIITGNDSSYLQRILNAGFDGVYLDIIDAFEYWEAQ
jgi:cysteinyl-tRNA synthetase, unknown class